MIYFKLPIIFLGILFFASSATGVEYEKPKKTIEKWGLLSVIEAAKAEDSESKIKNIRESLDLLVESLKEDVEYMVLDRSGASTWTSRYRPGATPEVKAVVVGELASAVEIASRLEDDGKAFMTVDAEPSPSSREGMLSMAMLTAVSIAGGDIEAAMTAFSGRRESELLDLIENYGCCEMGVETHEQFRQLLEDDDSQAYDVASSIIDAQRELKKSAPKRFKEPLIIIDGRYVVPSQEKQVGAALILIDKALAEKEGIFDHEGSRKPLP